MLTRRKLLAHATAALAPGAVLAAWPPGMAIAAGRPVAPSAPAAREPTPREVLLTALSWGYQLQSFDLRALTSSAVDVLVVDYSITGADTGRLSEATVRRLKRKPDGDRRIVLAYLSIGEAEEYRYYWSKDWIETEEPARPATNGTAAGGHTKPTATSRAPASALPKVGAGKPVGGDGKPKRWLSPSAPVWLGDENESWSGNFAVKYWDPGWQSLIVGSPGCYLERILAAGFDGVYLDRVDAFYEFDGERPDPAADMIAFVARIATEARAKVPGFLVVPQNAEELLTHPAYVATIDAIAKEDLLYGGSGDGEPNNPAQITNSVGWLSFARRADRPVLIIEYLDDAVEIAKARGEIQRLGYVPTFGPRALDQLSPDVVEPKPEPRP